MTTLTYPNTIANGQLGDATKVQQNFDAARTFVNAELINRDGTVGMTQPLGLVAPTAANHAARKADVDAAIPIGTVMMFGGTAAPSAQWLLCRGQAVSRTAYADLFAVLGTAYGVGDNVTTFNLPDLRGRYPFGHNEGGTYGQLGVGQVFGSKDLIVPSHAHSVSINSGWADTDHSHSGSTGAMSANAVHSHYMRGIAEATTAGGLGEGNVADISNGSYAPAFNTSDANIDHVHGFTTGGMSAQHSHAVSGNTATTGSSATNANLPPSQSFNFLIRALAA